MSILKGFKGRTAIAQASPIVARAVQYELARIGLYQGAIDGIAGTQTLAAFRKFKQQNHLSEPEILGKTTAEKLLQAKSFVVPKTKDDHIKLIISECRRQGITDPRQLAYVLATVKHETAGTYEPIDEYGGQHTRYSPYWGRGYVQLTWKSNYQKYAHLTGKDLVNHPELAKDPATAAFILAHGFKHGTFTGRKLNDYIQGDRCDYINARRCINGTDRAELIASIAKQWIDRLNSYSNLA